MTNISAFPAPVLQDDLFHAPDIDGDLDLSCILNDIFPEPPIEEKLICHLSQPAPSTEKMHGMPPMVSSTYMGSKKCVSQQEVPEYSLVSDDEMSQNNFSVHSEIADKVRESIPTKVVSEKTKLSETPEIVSSSNVISNTSTQISNQSRKRPAEESDTTYFPGESKQKVQRRERNREHAKKSRSRKKDLTKSLEESLVILKAENKKLKGFVVAKFGDEETKKKVKKAIVTPNDRLVAALQQRSNRVLSNSAISYLKSLGSDLKR